MRNHPVLFLSVTLGALLLLTPTVAHGRVTRGSYHHKKKDDVTEIIVVNNDVGKWMTRCTS